VATAAQEDRAAKAAEERAAEEAGFNAVKPDDDMLAEVLRLREQVKQLSLKPEEDSEPKPAASMLGVSPVEALFQEADTDGDGNISKEEFERFMTAKAAQEANKPALDEDQELARLNQVVANMEKQNVSLEASTPKHSAPVEAIGEAFRLPDDDGPPTLYSPPILSSPPSAEAALPWGGEADTDAVASLQQPEPTFAVHKAVARHRTQPHAAEPPSTPKRSQSPRRAKRQQSTGEADGGISERDAPTTQEGNAAHL